MTLRRKIANMFYGIGHAFESAKVSLSRGNPNTLNPTDASAELPSYTRSELVRKARYLEKNSGHIRGILRDLKVYGIGKGIYPNAKSDNHAWNKQAEDFFFKWSRHCDTTNRFSWRECQSMILRSLIVDGEIFVIKTFDSFGIPKIQLIESHRLMSPSDSDSGRIVDGMEFDKFGRVKNYHFVVGDNSQTTKVPANAVLHIFAPEQLGRLKGAKLAEDVLLDILSVITKANFGEAILTRNATDFDTDDIIDLETKIDELEWPDSPRGMLLKSSYMANVKKDIKTSGGLANFGFSALGELPNLLGFSFSKFNRLPHNNEKLQGFVVYPSAIMVALAPIQPTANVMKQLSTYTTYTDPQTGLTLEYRAWGDADTDASKEIIECNYGFGVGESKALKRIVSE